MLLTSWPAPSENSGRAGSGSRCPAQAECRHVPADPRVGSARPALASCKRSYPAVSPTEGAGEGQAASPGRQWWSGDTGPEVRPGITTSCCQELTNPRPIPRGSEHAQLCPTSVPVSSPPRGRKPGTVSHEGLQITREPEIFF